MNRKFIMSYSCGKDSTLALYRMINKGFIPVALLITINKEMQRSWFHGITHDLLKEVTNSLNIPLLLVKCDGNEYEELFEKTLLEGKKLGADICVFGDIDIEAHRKWCTLRCKNVLMGAEFPLWQEDRENLTYEFIDLGFSAIVKNVKLEILGEEFLGEKLTRDLVQKIKECGSDPCGENGEYHTFVYDGPIFKYPIPHTKREIIKNNGYGYLDIVK